MQKERTLYVSVSPVAGVGQVAVVQDITPLKELEAMRLGEEQEEHHRLRRIFEQYVSPELMDRILAQDPAAVGAARAARCRDSLYRSARLYAHDCDLSVLSVIEV